MKIVHLNKNDIQGGAARAAYRLHKGLQRAGHESSMLVASRTSGDPSVMAVERRMDLLSRLRRGLRQHRMTQDFRPYQKSRPAGFELFSDDRSEYASTLPDQIPACDVINLHWVPAFIDYEAFFARLPESKPMVWTLHDMNPFTGGCHYDLGCGRYIDHCGACPQLGSKDEHDLSFQIRERKQRVFSRVNPSRLHLVTPSRWLADEVKRSPILGKFEVSVIPNGLDTDDFAPRNRNAIRDLLGIARDARVVLFVAEQMNNRRKGFALLSEALARCVGMVPNLLLLSLGGGKPQVDAKLPSLHIGALDNDRFLSMVYSAADIFVISSLQDNLPNTVLEALACGVPVVGVRVGGIPDMVRHGVSGLTVDCADAGALAAAISDLLNGGARLEDMRAGCRRIAIEEYPVELQAKKYFELYKTLV